MKFALSAAAAAFLLTSPVTAEPFVDWLEGVRAEALANGVGRSVLEAALRDLEGPLPRVLELDRKQWKRDVTLDWYLNRVISDERVDRGREMGRRYRSLLTQVSETYGVQPRFILAIWGIETHYGKITGGFPVLGALATLAFDGRRQEFFRGELLEALSIMERERMEPTSMLGSWAGAMGQSQFMPTSFSNFAQDYDGDGRRDIWTTEADVFASIAHYLKRHGWRDDITWGRAVKLPSGFDPDLIGLDVARTIPEWQALGVRRVNGTDLPSRALTASVVAPDYPDGDAFLVYENFRVTLTYNRSSFYATAVGILSDQIARGSEMRLAAAFTMFVCVALLMSACSKPAPVVMRQGIPQSTPQGTPQVSSSGGIYKVGAPYTVAGRRYTPKVQPNYRAEGLASWYGPKFHGKRTANGEIFDQYALTAAHKTLPLPSKVRVTNLDNGRQLVVRVNDRGPFVGDRIIDLSRRSAQLLGVEKVGVAPVRLELLDSGPHLLTEPLQREQAARESVTPVRTGRVYVQVGAFRLPDNAQRLAWKLSQFGDASIHVSENRRWHRVRFGPFVSAREADVFVQRLERAGYLPNVVIQVR